MNGDEFLKHMQPLVDRAAKGAEVFQTKYALTVAHGTTCSDCGRTPVLLAPQTFAAFMPVFYVCECGRIGQVGVGRVPVSVPEKED